MNDKRIPAAEKALAVKIRAILCHEASKDISEMDDDLVAECADFLMELENRTHLTQKEISREVNKILAKGHYKQQKRISLKHLLIAAILAAMLAASYLFAPVSGNDKYTDYLKSIFMPLIMSDSQKSVYHGKNEYRLYNSWETEKYETVEEFYEKEKLDVLYPSALPRNKEIDYILVDKNADGKAVRVSYIAQSDFFMDIQSGEDFSSFIDAETAEFEVINGLNCFYYIFDDVGKAQCGIIRNGFVYNITAASYDDMVYIINNLKEF